MCIIDSTSLKSLQVFNNIDYNYAYRHSLNRTRLRNKPNQHNITLYSLYLSKMHTKIGIGKLRSFLMKPTRNQATLKERHRVVEFFMNDHNMELTKHVKTALKKCKFVQPIFKRMKETRCNFNKLGLKFDKIF